jgi:hypothetical protein
MRDTLSWLTLSVLLFFPQTNTAPNATVAATLARHATAVGGDALRAVRTRITRGTFDNGRMRVPFVSYEKAPNKRVTVIGTDTIDSAMGSARGFDGRQGWDKNVIGTGLRDVTGRELQDLAREADLLSPARPGEACVTIEAAASPPDGARVLRCDLGSGRTAMLFFAAGNGLLYRRDVVEGGRSRSSFFEDYRQVDGVSLPFRTRYVTGPSTITYTVERVEHNAPVDDARFERPKS